MTIDRKRSFSRMPSRPIAESAAHPRMIESPRGFPHADGGFFGNERDHSRNDDNAGDRELGFVLNRIC